MQTERPIAIKGPMTIYEAIAQKRLLLDALEDCEQLELDLSQVDELDTAGVQVLVLAAREASRLNKPVKLVAISEAVQQVLDLYNLRPCSSSGEAAWRGDDDHARRNA